MEKKVIMTKDQTGSPNGIATVLYKEGQEYTIPERLAETFVDTLKCAKYSNVLIEEEIEIKQVSGAPENKMMNEAPENKKGKKGK